MSIRLTDELKAKALEVADLYAPLEPPLLVGSSVWLGEGNDIDVVVRVKDPRISPGGVPCYHEGYAASWPNMLAYRHGEVNVIAVGSDGDWAGWKHAGAVMPYMPKYLMEKKNSRVSICECLRIIGKAQWLLD